MKKNKNFKIISIITILLIFLIGSILFATNDFNLKQQQQLNLKQQQKTQYNQTKKTIDCNFTNFTINTISNSWICDVEDKCKLKVTGYLTINEIGITNKYYEFEFKRSLEKIDQFNTSNIQKKIKKRFKKTNKKLCKNKYLKLKKDYEYNIRLK